jgi:uncharacterized membrane-anchored protein YjiN (DUF445 family)
VLDDSDGLRQEASASERNSAGTLRPGAIPTTLAHVPLLTESCLQQFPSMRHEIYALSAAETLQRTRNFELDIGLGYLEDNRLGDFHRLRVHLGKPPGRHRAQRLHDKSMEMNKKLDLEQNKNRALLFLLVATCVFVTTALFPRGFWVDGIKAVSEAAMVGALADWFAVAALFWRIPIPFVSAHTDIISRNKDRIADNLANFVREKFLDVSSIVGLIRKHDPAQRITEWLSAPANTDLLGDYVVKLTGGILDLTDDVRLQTFIKDALDAAIDKVDLSKSMGAILDTLTKDGRHQELLDEGIAKFVALLREPTTRSFIAARLVDWLKSEYPTMEKFLPTNWLGESGAEMIANAVDTVLMQISDDPNHQLRRNFDDVVERLIIRLKTDRAFLEKGEEVKRYVTHSETLNLYVKGLWGQVRAWLKQDLARSDSTMHAKAVAMGKWVGGELAQNAQLRQSLNEHMEDTARAMAPDFAQFLTRHISDTVKHWDSREMSRQIELNIGKDLQYIRINGTMVGGFIGFVLYGSSYLIDVLRAYVV